MATERNSINEINKVCKAALKLTDADFEAAGLMAQEQSDYNHPLKMATAGWQHELGEHNRRVLEALKTLRDTIKNGENIHKP